MLSSDEMSLIDNLSVLPLFSELDRLELTALTGIMTVRKAEKGDRLLQEGQPPSGLFVILGGALSVRKGKGGECEVEVGFSIVNPVALYRSGCARVNRSVNFPRARAGRAPIVRGKRPILAGRDRAGGTWSNLGE